MLERLKVLLLDIFHIFFRHFNFPCELGLRTVGRPDELSPVFLSGNYTLTVHRLLKRLARFDCYLIVANSKGSNVWCAAGMNEFNEFDIIDAINVSGIKDKVLGRRIIAPPYAAPGVDVREVHRQTGFKLAWGPTHFDDLPAYIEANYRRNQRMTEAQFGLSDRLEQALSTALVYCVTIAPLAFFFPRPVLIFMALVSIFHLTWFGLSDFLPEERRWAKTLTHLGIALAGLAVVALWSAMPAASFAMWAGVIAGLILLISLDGCGSSTLYKTTPGHWLRKGDYRSHFEPIIDPKKCTSCYDCVYVCPKGVLARVPKGPAVSVRPDACIECLACVKVCYDDAFYNRSRVSKGDVKSINNLEEIMTREWRHLEDELKWVDAPVRFDKHMLVVDIAAMAEQQQALTPVPAAVPVEQLDSAELLAGYDSSFESARARFVALCKEFGLALTEHRIVGDATLCIGHLGPRDSPRKLVILSGVHGVEGFAGSAAQIAFLQRYRDTPLAVHVLLVHIVNPEGMRHFRRNAPGNIDLNRNLVDDHSARAQVDDSSRAIAELMSGPRFARLPTPLWLLWLAVRLRTLGGIAKLRQVFAAGQYFDSSSLFYGGTAHTAEVRALLEALREQLSGCKPADVVFFDLHSGIGGFGRSALLANDADSTAAEKVFGVGMRRGHHGKEAVYPVTGDLVRGIKAELGLNGACAVTFECGTGPALATLLRLRYENCTHQHFAGHGERSRRARERMLRAFCPRSMRWRTTYVRSANNYLDRALSHLSGAEARHV
ncbi:DUF2817 domain-containing protein [Mesorhizobium sp. M0184]|uniref:HgcAB-like fusion protein n=1 Tax=Mesorhizobium sp. M0184 TaxID=2956906 RepID=UPI003335EBD6